MKTMLIATDFSEAATHAARYATAIAREMGMERIVLYHTFDIVPTAVDMTGTLLVSYDNEIYRSRIQLLDELKSELYGIAGPGISIVDKTDRLTFRRGIDLSVTEYDAGIVSIGLTGKSKLERLLVGSNTARLLRNCRVPLLVVPAVCIIQPVRTIVFACNFRKVEKGGPYPFIKELVCRLGVKLLVVNVVNDDQNDDSVLDAQDELNSVFDGIDATYHYTSNVHTEEGILSFAESYHAQLVIAIAEQHSLADRLLKGSVSEKLTFMTRIPTLIVR